MQNLYIRPLCGEKTVDCLGASYSHFFSFDAGNRDVIRTLSLEVCFAKYVNYIKRSCAHSLVVGVNSSQVM